MSRVGSTSGGKTGRHVVHLARTLGGVVQHARCDEAIRKNELEVGDKILVKTRNSVYRLEYVGDDSFLVSGGWFNRKASTGLITVNGCTYGGSLIRHEIVAGPGLFLEFGNNVTTTRIQRVQLLPRSAVRVTS